jgi:hypothetical protein
MKNGTTFRAMRIKLKDGGRILLRIRGKRAAEFEMPKQSTIIILRRTKPRQT